MKYIELIKLFYELLQDPLVLKFFTELLKLFQGGDEEVVTAGKFFDLASAHGIKLMKAKKKSAPTDEEE